MQYVSIDIPKVGISRRELFKCKENLLKTAELLAELAVDHTNVVDNLFSDRLRLAIDHVQYMIDRCIDYAETMDSIDSKMKEAEKAYKQWNES